MEVHIQEGLESKKCLYFFTWSVELEHGRVYRQKSLHKDQNHICGFLSTKQLFGLKVLIGRKNYK